jgi:hypothetical protein
MRIGHDVRGRRARGKAFRRRRSRGDPRIEAAALGLGPRRCYVRLAMTTDDRHRRAERFDFHEERHTGVFVCERVGQGEPILFVAHDGDGDWQFLCGGQHSDPAVDPAVLACLECTVAADPTLNELAELQRNASASRERAGAAWEQHDGTEDFIHETVERVGWSVLAIPAGERDDEPAFAYTVGLHKRFGHPEIIVLGLPHELMHELLDVCGERIKAGETLPVGTPFGEVLDGCSVQLRPVRAVESYREHVGYAMWFNGGPEFGLLQLVWPDDAGRFPGEPGADPDAVKQQPLLP